MPSPNDFQRNVLESAVRIGLLFILIMWCFSIIEPFVMPIVWAGILAVALQPIYLKIKKLVGKESTAATLLVIVLLALILLPGWNLAAASVDTAMTAHQELESGTLEIPAPKEAVKSWPLVGDQIFNQWGLAAVNLQDYLTQNGKELAQIAKSALGAAGGALGTILMFCFSIVISGIFLANGPACNDACKRFARSCAGERGNLFVTLAASTIQSVAKGVLGVAVIQTALVSIGFFAMGIPAAALLSVLVLIFAIAQLPPMLVALPAIVYVFHTDSTTVAILFTIWTLLASSSDTLLKPLLLGRGVDVPMLVILLGALGGMIMSGIVGLFIGAVVLAVGYRLLMVWIDMHDPDPACEKDTQ